jgi:hypothetical protein
LYQREQCCERNPELRLTLICETTAERRAAKTAAVRSAAFLFAY